MQRTCWKGRSSKAECKTRDSPSRAASTVTKNKKNALNRTVHPGTESQGFVVRKMATSIAILKQREIAIIHNHKYDGIVNRFRSDQLREERRIRCWFWRRSGGCCCRYRRAWSCSHIQGRLGLREIHKGIHLEVRLWQRTHSDAQQTAEY